MERWAFDVNLYPLFPLKLEESVAWSIRIKGPPSLVWSNWCSTFLKQVHIGFPQLGLVSMTTGIEPRSERSCSEQKRAKSAENLVPTDARRAPRPPTPKPMFIVSQEGQHWSCANLVWSADLQTSSHDPRMIEGQSVHFPCTSVVNEWRFACTRITKHQDLKLDFSATYVHKVWLYTISKLVPRLLYFENAKESDQLVLENIFQSSYKHDKLIKSALISFLYLPGCSIFFKVTSCESPLLTNFNSYFMKILM